MNILKIFGLVIIITTFLYGSAVSAADGGSWGTRGSAWARFNLLQKGIYVTGMFDIIATHDGILLSTHMPSEPSTETYIQGIDKHYADYRNQLIPVPFILEVVGMEISGASQEEIENRLQMSRRIFANLEN